MGLRLRRNPLLVPERLHSETEMAYYKYDHCLQKSNSDAYDFTYGPGATVPHSGIYRCQGCGREIASNKGDPFPPQNHHQHAASQPIKWQLAVYADPSLK